MSTVPPIIATIGLHGSASTWVFNVVRELVLASVGENHLQSLVADTVGELPSESIRDQRHLVIKSHHGSSELDAWLAASQARIILSIRDPRDACLSMAQRFKVPLSDVARLLTTDCRRMMALAAAGHPLLRYEDRFFDASLTVAKLGAILGLHLPPPLMESIFTRYQTEAVRTFAQALGDLPPQRVTRFGSSHLLDQLTQIHGVHIGDTRSGKWRHLPHEVKEQLAHHFAGFLARFGYSH